MHPLRRIASITSLALVIGATLVACAAPDIPIRTGPAALGSWDTIDIPEDVQINAIHSVALPTGDVLLIAGSGNDVKQFAAGTFETLLYSPATGQTELIDTPEDLFCNGHAHLPNGNILVAGGTQAYETAPEQLTNAGGVLTLVNETPQKEFFVAKGTQVVGEASGKLYLTDSDITIPKAKYDAATDTVTSVSRNVYISSVDEGEVGVSSDDAYHVVGLTGDDALNLHGYAQAMGFEKKDYQGIDSAYEFDPWQKKYMKVSNMNYARWYPTLTAMSDGNILTLSGLDAAGKILDGNTNEIYDTSTQTWIERPDLDMMFPTYPSVFQTDKEGMMFSAGINQGWGPAEQGREPGFWNLEDNSFTKVPSYRDPDMNETGAVGWLGPANDQQLIVVGGGTIGDTPASTGRIDVIDLDSDSPHFEPLADLPQGTRYPNIVTLPSGDVFITNGSTGYRGRGKSDILKSYLLSQDGTLTELASPTVGRNYHSSALLLDNGQILVAGSDPLFSDANDTVPGEFEKQIEIYTPPYLFDENGTRAVQPVIDRYPDAATYNQAIDLDVTPNTGIAKVRLLYPGAVTHVTDTNQRLVELKFWPQGNGVRAVIPDNPSLVPPGYYMLVVIDEHGVTSEARWIHISQNADTAETSGHHH
jgi:hypothetical protein